MFLSIPQFVRGKFQAILHGYAFARLFLMAGVIGNGASGRILINSIDDVIIDILPLTVTMGICVCI